MVTVVLSIYYKILHYTFGKLYQEMFKKVLLPWPSLIIKNIHRDNIYNFYAAEINVR